MLVTHGKPWTRKHEHPAHPLFLSTPAIAYPESLKELIEICRDRAPDVRFKAAGSHWALSEAAISDNTFVETHPWDQTRPRMDKTLYEVIPGCVHPDLVRETSSQRIDSSRFDAYVHFESGKRIYQIYSELDYVPDGQEPCLARTLTKTFHPDSDYHEGWAFGTLGGAGGQTVVGAFSTGTHGGDLDRPPIADAIEAIHLVTDGGKHYWIEKPPDGNAMRSGGRFSPIVDDAKLREIYGIDDFGGSQNFEIIRDWAVFNAVLVGVGRFGVIYAVVMKVVRQYCLHEERRLNDWQEVKDEIRRVGVDSTPTYLNSGRFLQVAVSVTPHDNWQRNRCGITKRSDIALQGSWPGRAERRGKLVRNDGLFKFAPLFENAGNAYPFDPQEGGRSPGSRSPTILERACENSDFIHGIRDGLVDEFTEWVENKTVQAGKVIDAVTGIDAVAPAVEALIDLVKKLCKALKDLYGDDLQVPGQTFGETMDGVREALLGDPELRPAGLLIWHALAYEVFELMQKEWDIDGISYAVMDRHSYRDRSCEVNVDSIEVFFGSMDTSIVAYVDSLLDFERKQEALFGKAFIGYISLRFMGPTSALIGMQDFLPCTCAIEVSCLKDVSGSMELLEYAIKQARDPNFNAIFHWGQRNDCSRVDIERRFGRNNKLKLWRNALARLTDGGRLNGFSSEFSRRCGLEVI